MAKIGIMGGTFDPVHKAHIHMADAAREQYGLDKIIFLIAGNPPHKQGRAVTDSSDRVNMLTLALEKRPEYVIDKREIIRTSPSYSYITLQEFTEEYPEDEIYFIVGFDSARDFKTWYKPEIISSLATILIAPRDTDNPKEVAAVIDELNDMYIGDFKLLDMELFEVSSTDIRNRVDNNLDISMLVEPEVMDYIKEHGLYNKDYNYSNVLSLMEEMKKELKTGRYIHTWGVSQTCGALANAHGYDLYAAMVAGALHDCAKCIDNEKKIKLCKKYKIDLTDVELANPELIHAKLGAYLAKEKYGIEDEAIIHAIAVHTTGCPNMSLLDLIVFISDYIEPSRDKAPHLNELRSVAFSDLEKCAYMILEDTVKYLKDNPKAIDETTMDTYQFYKAKFEK